jgi:hypothetical protein
LYNLKFGESKRENERLKPKTGSQIIRRSLRRPEGKIPALSRLSKLEVKSALGD